jgi:hypothetical protein
MMDIDNLKNWAALFQSFVTTAAICVGGTWSYFRYIRKREHIWNIDLVPTISIHALSSQRVLVSYLVDIKNIGQQPFIPGTKGLLLTVRRVEIPTTGVVDWENCENTIDSIDILEKYKSLGAPNYNDEYTLDVGGCYKESVSFVLEAGYFYMLKTVLHGQPEVYYLTDYHLVDARLEVKQNKNGGKE